MIEHYLNFAIFFLPLRGWDKDSRFYLSHFSQKSGYVYRLMSECFGFFPFHESCQSICRVYLVYQDHVLRLMSHCFLISSENVSLFIPHKFYRMNLFFFPSTRLILVSTPTDRWLCSHFSLPSLCSPYGMWLSVWITSTSENSLQALEISPNSV